MHLVLINGEDLSDAVRSVEIWGHSVVLHLHDELAALVKKLVDNLDGVNSVVSVTAAGQGELHGTGLAHRSVTATASGEQVATLGVRFIDQTA